MPSFKPRAWTLSAVPLIPSGKVVALGIIWLVVVSRPDLTDQQSSTRNYQLVTEGTARFPARKLDASRIECFVFHRLIKNFIPPMGLQVCISSGVQFRGKGGVRSGISDVRHTVYIFVTSILKAHIDNLVGSIEDLLLGDITVVCIPRVPAQCRQFPLHLPISSGTDSAIN